MFSGDDEMRHRLGVADVKLQRLDKDGRMVGHRQMSGNVHAQLVAGADDHVRVQYAVGRRRLTDTSDDALVEARFGVELGAGR